MMLMKVVPAIPAISQYEWLALGFGLRWGISPDVARGTSRLNSSPRNPDFIGKRKPMKLHKLKI
jgi:hypothetical protein